MNFTREKAHAAMREHSTLPAVATKAISSELSKNVSNPTPPIPAQPEE